MVLQRFQTVYLLLAAVMSALFFFLPTFDCTSLYATTMSGNGIVMGILAVLSIVLCLIATFSYRNLKRQAMICGVTLLIMAALLVLSAVRAYDGHAIDGRLPSWPSLLLPLAMLLVWLGRRGVIADKKLIESADRIR